MKKPKTLIVDESVSEKDKIRFEKYLQNKNYKIIECLNIREQHPGMPDFQILQHFINKSSILVTTDRPFHNKTLSKGFLSFYINEKEITGKSLPGIYIKPDILTTTKNSIIKDSYHPPSPEIRNIVMPTSATKLKKLTTKRRRIRNHFGGLENIDEIAVTISLQPIKGKILIGIRLQVTSNIGIKAITGSESYIIENMTDNKHVEIISICYALIMVIRLTLYSIKTVIYYDSSKIRFTREKNIDYSPYNPLFFCLRKMFF